MPGHPVSNCSQSRYDTKLCSDIAEAAVTTELLRRGLRVLRPIGDRLPYDLAIDWGGRLIRIQVKSAWFEPAKQLYTVDVRRTKTNRREMRRARYDTGDFDVAIVYVPDRHSFYVMPVEVFMRYRSGISLVESRETQRLPRSAVFRERWDLLNPAHRGGHVRKYT